MLDVVRRYDVDGVHIDDYFYPYPETAREPERRSSFPTSSRAPRIGGGGTLVRDDWRRSNVDVLVRELYASVKAEKRWVRVGSVRSGSGVRGSRHRSRGIEQYEELYADVRTWLNDG